MLDTEEELGWVLASTRYVTSQIWLADIDLVLHNPLSGL